MQGQTENLQLNQNGVRQATNLKNKLMNVPFTVCFTSPLIRAWSTAMILVGDRVEIKEDKRLIERYLGNLEGKDRSLYSVKKYWDYNLNSNSENVEPIQDIFKRCNSFLDDLKKNYQDDDTILIVSHGAITRCLHHILNNSDLSKNLVDFKIENCYCSEYELIKEK
jgi:broad specificity phosphatase PhoE